MPMRRNILTGVIVFLMFAIPVAFVFGPPLWRDMRARRILAHGVPAEARVTGFRDTGKRLNYQAEVVIHLEVTPKRGAPYPAVVRAVIGLGDLGAFAPGNLLRVKYDPAHPRAVAIVDSGP